MVAKYNVESFVMTATMIMFGLMITALQIVRPILYKPAAQLFPAEKSVAFTGVWLILSICITMPFLHNDMNWKLLAEHPCMVMLTIIKGAALWLVMFFQQIVNKESTSSSVFYTFIVLALGSLILNVFFNENLAISSLMAIMGFGVLGVVFVLRGDIKNVSSRGKFAFVGAILCLTYCMISDHLVISRIGWYPHLVISSIVMMVLSLTKGINLKEYKNFFANKNIAYAGIVYVLSEYLVIYSSIKIMPVSYAGLFVRLATPIVMIISAVKYKEQNIRTQATFGIIALALAMIIIWAGSATTGG